MPVTRLRLPKLEYKCKEDDAWYSVTVELKDSALKVHYPEFPEEDDEILEFRSFKTFEDVKSRLRLASLQLQDPHCRDVKVGTALCASCSSDGEDIRFFDAVVQEIHHSEHFSVDDEEVCPCTFHVLWQAGPNSGQITPIHCENICLLNEGTIESHPVLNTMKQFVEKRNSTSTTVCKNSMKTTNNQKVAIEKQQSLSTASKRMCENSHHSDSFLRLHESDSAESGYLSSQGLKGKHADVRANNTSETAVTPEDSMSKTVAISHEQRGVAKHCTDTERDTSRASQSSVEKCRPQQNVKCSPIQSNMSPQNLSVDQGIFINSHNELKGSSQGTFHSDDRKAWKFPSSWGKGKRQKPVDIETPVCVKQNAVDSVEGQNTNISRFYQKPIDPSEGVNKTRMCLLTDPSTAHYQDGGHCVSGLSGAKNQISEGSKVAGIDLHDKNQHTDMHSSMKVLLFDNVEKDLNSSDMMNVLSALVSGIIKVIILPAFNFECFTRGLVFFRDSARFLEAYATMQSDNFLIVSSRGRPWVMLEPLEFTYEDNFGEFTADLELQDRQHLSKPLASGRVCIIYKGSQEYEKAKRMKAIFTEFREHYRILHKRLEFDERNLSSEK